MDDLEKFMRTAFISSILTTLHEEGEMRDFIAFGREQLKKDKVDDEELFEFFDFLEKLEDEEDGKKSDELDWIEIADAITKETGCEVSCFRGDNTIIISNKKMTDTECLEYLETDKANIHLGRINKVLKPLGVELEFVEALNLPFEFHGFDNFIRFGVHKI